MTFRDLAASAHHRRTWSLRASAARVRRCLAYTGGPDLGTAITHCQGVEGGGGHARQSHPAHHSQNSRSAPPVTSGRLGKRWKVGCAHPTGLRCGGAPSLINAERIEIVTLFAGRNTLAGAGVSDRLPGAALVSQRSPTTGRKQWARPAWLSGAGRLCSAADPGHMSRVPSRSKRPPGRCLSGKKRALPPGPGDAPETYFRGRRQCQRQLAAACRSSRFLRSYTGSDCYCRL
jgi:hypothetical protein